MSDVVTLREAVDTQARDEVLAVLEAFADLARRGVITDVLLVGEGPAHTIYFGASGNVSKTVQIGMLERLKFRIASTDAADFIPVD